MTSRTAVAEDGQSTVGGWKLAARGWARRYPLASLVLGRLSLGLVTLFLVSVLVFAATQILPGNAAVAILGRTATPAHLHAVEEQLHLNRSAVAQYLSWLGGVLTLQPGESLATQTAVVHVVGFRLLNSAVVVVLAGLLGTVLGVGFGCITAIKRDSLLDHSASILALAVTALPEFVVAILLISVFATLVLQVLPAVSVLPPGTYPWDNPAALVLPVATLVVVITPYIFRMTRAAMIEALESEYVELASLKGLSLGRIIRRHALPNAIAPTVQVVGLNLLYLAGGIVVVEYIFNYPGIGQGLVNAVSERDVPVIQFIVVVLAAFYVLVNIATDVIALLATPRRRFPSAGAA